MKIVIVGAKGFVGKNIFSSLNELGHEVIPYTKSSVLDDLPNDVDLIIDATSQKNKKQCVKIVSDLSLIMDKCVKATLVILNSLSTIQTDGLSKEKFNFGSLAIIKTPYTNIKLYKERLICSSSLDYRTKYIYLPIIVGESGNWSRVLSRRHAVIPDLKFCPSIDVIEIAQKILLTKEKRKIIYTESELEKLFSYQPILRVESHDYYGPFSRFFESLLKQDYVFSSYFGYIFGLIYLKVRYRNGNAIPSFPYWGIFFYQEQLKNTFDKING